jgi:hypothetical protein
MAHSTGVEPASSGVTSQRPRPLDHECKKWRPRQASNPHPLIRSQEFYPFELRGHDGNHGILVTPSFEVKRIIGLLQRLLPDPSPSAYPQESSPNLHPYVGAALIPKKEAYRRISRSPGSFPGCTRSGVHRPFRRFAVGYSGAETFRLSPILIRFLIGPGRRVPRLTFVVQNLSRAYQGQVFPLLTTTAKALSRSSQIQDSQGSTSFQICQSQGVEMTKPRLLPSPTPKPPVRRP